MTSVRPRLLAAVPVLAVAFALMPVTAAPALDGCNGAVDVVLGTPKARAAGQSGAGTVTVVFEPNNSSFGSQALTLDASDLGGTPGAGDQLGGAVAWGFDDTVNPGCSMVAVGAPGAGNGRGKVYVFSIDKDGVLPGSVSVLSQGSGGVGGAAEAGDRFGASVLFGGDLGVRWLAIGAPHEKIGTKKDAGVVHVLKVGTTWGSGSVMYRQGKKPVPGKAETGDLFGAALGPGHDAFSLWVGAPGEDLGKKSNAGAVTQLRGSCAHACDAGSDVRLPGTVGTSKVITQNTKGVPGTAESGDQFGEVLSGYVSGEAAGRVPVVGVPHENVGKKKDAGVIAVAYPDNSWGAFQQGTKGSGGRVNDAPESGDRFGAALSAFDVVVMIGVPGEDVGSHKNAGMVHRMTASTSSFKLSGGREQSLTQNTKGVMLSADTGDAFGSSLAFSVNGGVVGVPGEDVRTGGVTHANAGVIQFFPYKSGAATLGLSVGADKWFHAGSAAMGGTTQTGARFGDVAFSVTQ